MLGGFFPFLVEKDVLGGFFPSTIYIYIWQCDKTPPKTGGGVVRILISRFTIFQTHISQLSDMLTPIGQFVRNDKNVVVLFCFHH